MTATCSPWPLQMLVKWLDPPGIVPLSKAPNVPKSTAHCVRRAPSPKGDGTRSILCMKAMDRADGVLASLCLGTCVRNVGSPVSCLFPEPSVLFFSWACAHGALHTIASRKKVQEELLNSPGLFPEGMFVLPFGKLLNNVASHNWSWTICIANLGLSNGC